MSDETKQPTEQQFVVNSVDDFQQQIKENKAVMRRYIAQYGEELNPDAEWIIGHAIQRYDADPLTLYLTNAVVHLMWYTPQTLHVRVLPVSEDTKNDLYFSYFVADTATADLVDLNISETEHNLTVKVGEYQYDIDKADCRIRCSRDEVLVWEDALFSWQADQEQVGLTVALQAEESSFGTGERAFELNLRGRKLPIWNTDPGGYGRGDDPINATIPFYLGVHSDVAYGILWDDPSRAIFDIGATDPDQLRITGETDHISCFFFAGHNVGDVLKQYTHITGRMPMPPLWALGYHQSRYSYMTQDEVLAIANEMRQRNIPCDVIYLDIHYMDGYRVFTWNQDNFPDMKGMIDQLHAMNFKLVPILDPGVKVDEGYVGHDTGIEKDIFLTYPDGEYVAGVVWPGLCYFPDFSNPRARDWWTSHLSDLLETGVDGIWNDMNEPLIFDDEAGPVDLPDFVQHEKDGHGATHKELHNVYGTLMAQASLQALEKHRPNKRQFTFTRACTAGTQRYASSWTGDNHSTWDDLHIALTTSLQMGLSGVAFTGSDIGGFMGDTTPELLTRWTQAGALMPFFRNHSAVDVVYQEPWRFGQPYEDIMRDAIQLRYRLMPYIYTAFAQHAFDGMPIIRPLFMAEANNANLRDIDDAFMLGDTLLVAPILKPNALRRTVYLPDGDWYDFHTHRRYHGGAVISVEAPLDKLPIFVKSGTVLPMWDNIQHLDNITVKTLKLRIYTDTGDTIIYEDAGEGLDYQKGDYSWVAYEAVENTDSLTLRKSREGHYSPSYDSVELQLVGSRSEITRIDVDGITHFDIKIRDDMFVITVDADFKEVHFKA